jgi:hypothetical protein
VSTQEFEIPAPGKSALMFLLVFGLAIPIVLLALIATTASQKAQLFSALPILTLLPLAAIFMAWSIHRRKLRLENGLLKAGIFSWQRTAVSALDLDAARIVDLKRQRELQPVRKIAGTAMPGYRSGYFRLRDKRRAYVVVTDTRRVLVLPKRAGGLLMFSLVRPEAVLDALRRATDDKAGSAR